MLVDEGLFLRSVVIINGRKNFIILKKYKAAALPSILFRRQSRLVEIHYSMRSNEKMDQARVFARILDITEKTPGAVSATRAALASDGIGLPEGIARIEDGILKISAAAATLFDQA